ncbi:energy-coupling factor transporter transmembrane component T [Pullulanibacillus sp. KACC 23026]|uniref:energy-coupling factor transporter transmembrane component T n=1 Tax=Pullulanibacillus sp. KACC 23026 TaxID=3028315 RepID=UPI0023AF24B0|nr:energy-coupling factor transporter transmembrane component T [Pullulanibacillus sp. KACC 23026]WEG11763.1 energy-coupling factor transporter transmembrane component T [Pullulanibacillus sp. KACC 23026]
MNRPFKTFHPFTCLIYLVGGFILVTLCQHPDFLIVDVIILGLYIVYNDRGRYFKQWGWTTLVFFLFFFLMNPLFNHRGQHILFYLGSNPIMLEAVIRGIMIALTLMALLFLTPIFNFLIPSDRFLFLFSRFLPSWALLIMLTLRFIPLFRHRLGEIESVQRARGLSVHHGSLIARTQSAMRLVQILVTWSLEEAIQTADSMTARGYGLTKRTVYNPFRFQIEDGVVLIIVIVLFILNLYGVWLGDSILSLTPVLETLRLQGREWFYLGVNALYFSIPLIIDGKEGIVWRSLKRTS